MLQLSLASGCENRTPPRITARAECIPMRSGSDPATAADLKSAYQVIATTTDRLEAQLAARMRRDHLSALRCSRTVGCPARAAA
ncbi:hypothetical protein B5D80_27980 [Micromonospora wenchangensis]|uniref:Uncharacterized protein n=2 Tax=Micromonospora wenchangensis TaxID=1185415 RepID=A0A246REW6_9ACTN|nr:hypothetical protein B5D80_27980 [Micromonospora wenchangensis]